MKKSFVLVFFFICISCNNGRKPFEKRIDKVFGGPVFRDLTIGDTYNKVLKTENKNYMQFPDTNIIKYMYHVSDTEEYHWAYIFEEDKIKEIQFDAYLGEGKDGARYLSLVQKRYDKILGISATKNGIISWNKGNIDAFLFDESGEAMMGKVRLVIAPHGDSLTTNTTPFSIYKDE